MVILFGLCLIVGILMAAYGRWDSSGDPGGVAFYGLVLAVVSIVVVFVVWPILYIQSYKELLEMEAFYDANKSAYESTIETTKNAIYKIAKDPNLRIDVENLQQSTNWSERLAEFRDAVIEYNTCIYKLRRYNETFVLSAMFANPRDDLKLIIVLQE